MPQQRLITGFSAACLAFCALTPAYAGVEQRLGKLMALPIMAKYCNLDITADQEATFNTLGPKLQKEAGMSDDQMNEIAQEIAKGLKPEDCKDISQHWKETVPALVDQAKAAD